MGLQWLKRLTGDEAEPRDGQALALEILGTRPDLLATGDVGPEVSVPALPRRGGVDDVVAAKVLGAHLANRHQISYPLTLDFRSLSKDEAVLMVEFAALAIAADGTCDTSRMVRASERLQRLGAAEEVLGRLESFLTAPRTLNELVPAARIRDKSAHAYAVSLQTLGPRSAVGQHYLAYLAARLSLTGEVAGSLNRRYRG